MPYSFNPLSGLGLDQSIPLDGAGKIPSDYLPSYVDDVVEYANLAGFPATGETGKIYVAIDTGFTYRWSGSVYIQINSLTGTFAADAGTDAAPSISIGTADNGLYAPAEDQVAISTNGTGRLFVDANGNVGVGTTSPGTPLEVESSEDILIRAESTDRFAHIDLVDNAATTRFTTDGATGTLRLRADNGNVATGSTIQFEIDGSEHARITSDGKLGLGTSSPGAQLHVVGGIMSTSTIPGYTATSAFLDRVSGYTRLASVGPDASNAGPIRFSQYSSNGSVSRDAVTIDGSGAVGIGTTSPAYKLDVASTTGEVDVAINSASGSDGRIRFAEAGTNKWTLVNQAASNNLALFDNTAGSQRLTVDSSGRLLVGTSTSDSAITSAVQIVGSGFASTQLLYRTENSDTGPRLYLYKSRSSALNTKTIVQSGDDLGIIFWAGADGSADIQAASIAAEVDGTPGANDMPGRLVFSTTPDSSAAPVERMRITSNGSLLTGGLTSQNQSSDALGIHGIFASLKRSNDPGLLVGRDGSDGVLVYFYQDGSNEGSISVSGTTVSYNGAHLSRWSQLPGGADRTEILRGTVLSNIDEMCGWGEEENEQLNRMQVSDVEGDPNVSGVFQAWDDDDDTYTDDFYCAMTGDFIIRIGVGVTVQRGDLLMSAGDGTAKPQDDDIIRSKTIAKVTSTYVTCTYDDGSYCVPCVLMAC